MIRIKPALKFLAPGLRGKEASPLRERSCSSAKSVIPAILICSVSTAASGQTVRYVDISPAQHVSSRDDQAAINNAYDYLLCVASIAGIANRTSGQVFLRQGTGDDRILSLLTNSQSAWKGFGLSKVSDDDLIRTYRSQIRGVVVWDPSVPSTSNVAISVAGAESAIPVRYDANPGSFYSKLTKTYGLPEIARFVDKSGKSVFTGKGTVIGTSRASSGSAKCDAYLWLSEKYVKTGKCGLDWFAVLPDAYVWFTSNQRPSLALSFASVPEIAKVVERKGLVVDLLPVKTDLPVDSPKEKAGTDYGTLIELMKGIGSHRSKDVFPAGGFVPWWKYTGDGSTAVSYEWGMEGIQTAFNMYGSSVENGSFMSKDTPLNKSYHQAKPTLGSLQARGYVDSKGRVRKQRVFVSFYAGDYDGTWINDLFSAWSDPHRGDIPITWAINPQLMTEAPRIYDYIRQNATTNDFFIMGDSGPGYALTRNFVSPRPHSGYPDIMDKWIQHCQRWQSVSDCDICWILDGNAGLVDSAGRQRLAGVFPRGILTQQPYGVTSFGSVPVLQLPQYSTAVQNEILAAPPRDSSRFMPVRFIKWSAKEMSAMANDLRSKSHSVEIIDMYSLMLLRKLALTNGYAP